MNLIGISGRLTKEPELRTTTNGKSVTSIDLAVKRPRVKDTTDFIPVVVWNQQAEYLCKYAHKGNLVGVEGRLTTRKYLDREGNNRTIFEVVADSVEIMESKGNNFDSQNDPLNELKNRIDEMPEDTDLPF